MDLQDKTNRKPHLGIMFKCCNIYSRIYINKMETAFVGWCPKCAKKAQINISEDGSDSKFFEIS